MRTKQQLYYHIKNMIIVTLFMIIVATAKDMVDLVDHMKSNGQEVVITATRTQQRRMLDDLVNRFEYAVDKGDVDYNNFNSLASWSKVNMAGMRIAGPTGDGFVLVFPEEIFLVDESPDCAVENVDVRGLDGEAEMHQDSKLAEETISKMKNLVDTKAGDNVIWNFDGSVEHLEWKVFPRGQVGFDDEPYTIKGIKNPRFKKILFVLGSQTDEVLKPYNVMLNDFDTLKQSTYIFLGISLIISLILSFSVFIFNIFKHIECEKDC